MEESYMNSGEKGIRLKVKTGSLDLSDKIINGDEEVKSPMLPGISGTAFTITLNKAWGGSLNFKYTEFSKVYEYSWPNYYDEKHKRMFLPIDRGVIVLNHNTMHFYVITHKLFHSLLIKYEYWAHGVYNELFTYDRYKDMKARHVHYIRSGAYIEDYGHDMFVPYELHKAYIKYTEPAYNKH